MAFSNIIQLLIYRMIKIFRAKQIFTVLLLFRLITLDPPDCCNSSSAITVVSALEKQDLPEQPKETLSLHHWRGLSAPPVSPEHWGDLERATLKAAASETHCEWCPLCHPPDCSTSSHEVAGIHATSQNKGFGNITLNEQSEGKKPTESESERAACPLTLWATEPTPQGFSAKQAEVQSQHSRSPRMWTIKGFITRKKKGDLSNLLLFQKPQALSI